MLVGVNLYFFNAALISAIFFLSTTRLVYKLRVVEFTAFDTGWVTRSILAVRLSSSPDCSAADKTVVKTAAAHSPAANRMRTHRKPVDDFPFEISFVSGFQLF